MGLLIVGGLPGMCAGPYNGGPGGPILVVTNSANPFTEYYAEILLTEGLNYFALRNISTVSSATLTAYEVVILGEMTLTTAQVTTFSNWVNGGGNLIAMRPDKKLAGLLGLTDAGSTLSQGYLLVNTSNGPGSGIVGETMQFHGTADRYTLGSASRLATLYSSAVTATVNPAVTWRSVGSNGGQAAAFTYDLARSVVLTRQGNPAWAGQERDGIAPLRSDDLFYGAASFDPQPDWINLDKVAIPQADEQQRLLANLILYMNADRKMLPRFWYFPRGHKAVVVMTGDDHANNGTAGRFDQYLAYSPSNSSVLDWEAVRSTSYLWVNTPLTDAQARAYHTNGFEIALHLNTGCADYTRSSLTTMFAQQLTQFRSAYPSLPSPTTHRTHCIAWSGYTIMPEVELLNGIRLDANYYYWPPAWVANRPGLFTGSGMPMRFAMTNGNVIDVYQAATPMTDESGQDYPYTIDTLLDRALGPEGYYGAFVANMHTDSNPEPRSDAIVTSALARGVPIISARQLLTWLDARNNASMNSIAWSSGTATLTFSVAANTNARGLHVMAPIPSGYEAINVASSGTSIGYSLELIKGILYAVFPVTNGNYEINFALDVTSPSVTDVSPGSGETGVSSAANVMVAFSEPLSASSVNTNTLILRDASNALVPAAVSYNASTFTGVLTPATPLASAAHYTATVKGGSGGVTDRVANPLASDFIWSFDTETAPPYRIGNTNNGSLTDYLWSGGAWINAGRFQAASNVTVTTMQAKVSAVPGRYKCALYTDNGGQPSRLLGSTVEVTSPATGWQVFPLTTAVALTNGGYYWLAIWSDDEGARVYYSSSSGGTLRWGLYNYGPWPNPISTSGGSAYQYCIFAYGATTAAPVALDLAVGPREDTTTNLTLVGQGGQGPLTYAILTGPTNGNVGSLNPNTGSVSYTPNLNYNGPDTFRYTVSDGSLQATGTVSLAISAVNDAPTVVLATNHVVVLEGSGTVAIADFALMTTGPANESGQSITNVAVLNVSNATLFAVGPVISPGGTLTFTPAANGNGVALVTVQARDNGGTANGGTNGSGEQTFTITVTPVNAAPVVSDDSYTLVNGATLDIPAPGVLTNDSDPEGGSLTAGLVSGPVQGVLNLSAAGGFSYTPTNHFSGADTFTYQASDGETNSGLATVSITVSNPIEISSVAVSNEVVTVTWSAISGKQYRLQYKDDWAEEVWTDLLPDVIASGTSAVGTNAVDGATQRFYRVKGLQ